MKASFLATGYHVIWSATSGLPGNMAELVEIKSYYIIRRETLAHKSIYDQFTTTTALVKIIHAKAMITQWQTQW